MTTATTTPNLRETQKEMAAAKRRHPAGKATPAKKAAPKAAPTPASKKLRWTFDEGNDRTMVGKVAQYAARGGNAYALTPGEGGWTATVEHNGKTTVLSENGSLGKAYAAVMTHNKAR
jgi:hypothetical protein